MSKILESVGAATGNPIMLGAGAIAKLLGFRSRATRVGKRRRPSIKGRGLGGSKKNSKRLLALKGFASRSYRGGGGRTPKPTLTSSGGPAVQTTNAPVAFARVGDLKPYFAVNKGTKDGVTVHSVDYLGSISQNATANTFSTVVFSLNPTSTTSFPYLASTIAPAYQRYKLKMLRLHYAHFVSTSQAGSIVMWHNSDPLATSPASSSQALNDSNSTEGAVYEDLRLDVDLRGMTSDWMYVGTSATDNRLNSAGQVAWCTDKNPAGGTAIGDMYVETVWEFAQRKLPTQNEPVALLRQICDSEELDEKIKREMLHALVDRMDLRVRSRVREEESELTALRRKLGALSVGAATPQTGRFSAGLTAVPYSKSGV